MLWSFLVFDLVPSCPPHISLLLWGSLRPHTLESIILLETSSLPLVCLSVCVLGHPQMESYLSYIIYFSQVGAISTLTEAQKGGTDSRSQRRDLRQVPLNS